MRAWKVLGLAGLAGVAASGVVLSRAERRRQALSPDEVRARLHARHAAALPDGVVPEPAGGAAPSAGGRLRQRWQRWRGRSTA